MSIAERVRSHVMTAPARSLLATSAVDGSPRAVECEFSRLCAAGEVVRVRKGLYWKGVKTRVGMAKPRPMEVAVAVAGPGSGPGEVAAAQFLGLTTQVPAVPVVAVPGRVPMPLEGVRFVQRPVERRIAGLRPIEVAVLEVLRAQAGIVEVPWPEVVATVRRFIATGDVRADVLTEEVRAEHHLQARERWADIARYPALVGA
jgi:hypothetical protein